MVKSISGVSWRLRTPRLALAAIVPLLLAVVTACSSAAPAPGQTTIAPPPTATPASPATNAATTAPAATPPPVPTSTIAPKESSAPAAPPPTVAPTELAEHRIDAEKLIAIEEASGKVYQLLEELIAGLGPRVSGSEEELRAARLLKERYESMGYNAEIQTFAVRRFDFNRWLHDPGENAAVVALSPVEFRLAGLPLTSSPNDTANSGPLVTLDLSEGEHMPEGGVDGKVVHVRFLDHDLTDPLVMQYLMEHVDRLADAGAVSVVFSRRYGAISYYRPFREEETPIPALWINVAEAQQLADLTAGAEEVVVSVQVELNLVESQNVIAELEGAGDAIVVIGAHYDIVPETETGANDNASGTAVVLALAQALALAEDPLPFTVRFVSFGAEEIGLYGSSHYVASVNDTELGRLQAMLNFDVVGSGDYTAVSGDPQLTERALKLAGELQLQAQAGSKPYGASSDHAPFEWAGIPVLSFWAPDVSRIHTPWDVMEFVEPRRLGETFLLAEALLTSGEFLP